LPAWQKSKYKNLFGQSISAEVCFWKKGSQRRALPRPPPKEKRATSFCGEDCKLPERVELEEVCLKDLFRVRSMFDAAKKDARSSDRVAVSWVSFVQVDCEAAKRIAARHQ